jgi:hypothetical protein
VWSLPWRWIPPCHCAQQGIWPATPTRYAVVVALVVARLILGAATSTPGDVAVDTTGASAAATVTSQHGVAAAPTASPVAASVQATPSTAAEPTSPPAAQPTPTAVTAERKPLLLLNPTTVRQGSSIGVTGSGFDAGATVDLVLKQDATDPGKPLTNVQVDKSGGFGGFNFPVSDSLPRGNFIVEAHQADSDKLARRTAVVAGGSPEVKLGTQVGKAGDSIVLALGSGASAWRGSGVAAGGTGVAVGGTGVAVGFGGTGVGLA